MVSRTYIEDCESAFGAALGPGAGGGAAGPPAPVVRGVVGAVRDYGQHLLFFDLLPLGGGGGGEEGAAVPWSLQAVLWSGACPNRYTEDRVADAAAWRAARSVRAGDTVAVRGWPGRTPQGRPSVFATGVHLVGLASDGILRFGY